MSSPSSGKFNHTLVMGGDTAGRLLDPVDEVDGVGTGLNAIGIAIIDAGFVGVRSFVVPGAGILWQVRSDTPEGVCFALLCDLARRGQKLPSVDAVIKLLLPLRCACGGPAK